MLQVGEIVLYIDARGKLHNLIIASIHPDQEDRISGIYLDVEKAAHLFSGGQWLESVGRVIDAVPYDHESKDAKEPRDCYLPMPKAFGEIVATLASQPVQENSSDPDVSSLLQKAADKEKSSSNDQGDESDHPQDE